MPGLITQLAINSRDRISKRNLSKEARSFKKNKTVDFKINLLIYKLVAKTWK